MRVESDHGERLRTVLAGQPAPRRGPRRALIEADAADDMPTVRRLPPPAPAAPVPPRTGHTAARTASPVPVSPPSPAPVVGVSVRTEGGAPEAEQPSAVTSGAVAQVKAFTARHLQAIGILVVVALVFTSVQLLRARPTEVPLVTASTAPSSLPHSSVPAATPTPAPASHQVHVLGAVNKPGVVRVPEGARVHDAIAAAGGLTSQAHLGSLNLAAPVVDGMQVIVASGPQETSTTTGDTGGSPQEPGSADGPLVNLNTATQAQLETLPGVGPATAAKIIAWREEHGKFNRIEELQEVDGIGAKTFERLKPLVTV